MIDNIDQLRVLVTGATGFIGRNLISTLVNNKNYRILAATRNDINNFPSGIEFIKIDSLSENISWGQNLNDVDIVIHLAARVHVMNDMKTDSLDEYRRANVIGTLNLAEQAAIAGVKRFIFISSIKVNGEETLSGKPFFADDTPAPLDAYGISKMEAEAGLKNVAEKYGMEFVIIRPVLVYGPGVKANFETMMSWVNKSIPLPLGSITNRRSLVAIENLTDLIRVCIDHPNAANQIFLVSDGEDLSTTELLLRIGKSLNKPAKLFPFPNILIEGAAKLVGRPNIAQRLFGSLTVDISKNETILGWRPPVKVDIALTKTAHSFLEKLKK